MLVFVSSDLKVESPRGPDIDRSEVLDPVVLGLLWWSDDDLGWLLRSFGSILLVVLLLRLFGPVLSRRLRFLKRLGF